MADQNYGRLKNADLEALLKVRGLPHTGKKADLVARLQEHDKQKAANPIEDEIDWDDDEDVAPAKPAVSTTTTTTAAAKKEESKPAAGAPVKTTTPAAAATNGTAAAARGVETTAAKDTTTEAPVAMESFAAGLASTSVDDEIEKRRRRINRFTNPNDENSVKQAEEELKLLDRMEKFKDTSITNKMDAALPERKRKRGGEDEDGENRGGFKHRGNRRFGRGGRGGRGGRRGGRATN